MRSVLVTFTLVAFSVLAGWQAGELLSKYLTAQQSIEAMQPVKGFDYTPKLEIIGWAGGRVTVMTYYDPFFGEQKRIINGDCQACE